MIVFFRGGNAAPAYTLFFMGGTRLHIHTVACISPHCTNAQASCISFFRPVRLHVGEFHSDHVYFDRGSKAESTAAAVAVHFIYYSNAQLRDPQETFTLLGHQFHVAVGT